MKTFKDLKFKVLQIGGVQAVMNFENNYGVSVIKYNGTYGYHQGLWEVGILYKGALTYNTDIANNVLINQTEQGVTDIMKKVQKLKE